MINGVVNACVECKQLVLLLPYFKFDPYEKQAIRVDSEEEEVRIWGEESRAINLASIHNQKIFRSLRRWPHQKTTIILRRARLSHYNVHHHHQPPMDHQLSLSAIQGAQIKASL